MSDDLTGQYMNSRPPELTPSQIAKANRPQQDSPVTLSGALDTVGDIASDVGSGIIEAPRQVIGGVLDATKELAQFFESAIPLGTLDGGDTTEDSFITADEPRSTTGGLVRGVSQFLTGFLPGMQAGKAAGLGTWTSALISGAATDAFFFDPHEERLSNLIQDNEALANPVTEFLAADEDDSAALGRFKNTIEGLGLGAATEGFILGTKAIRANRINAYKQRKLIADTQKAKDMVDLDSTGLPARMTDVPDQEFIPFEEQAAKASVDFKTGSGKAGDEAAQNINLNNIDSTEEVDQLIEAVAKTDAKKINKARREVITNIETEKLADSLGMSVDDLLARRKGEAFNAEQAVAARKILVASGENVFNLAKKASTGSETEVALFNRALNQHRAIQAQVSGLTAEAGRALQSFRIQAGSAAGQQRAISESLKAGGGAENIRDIASRVSQFDEAVQLNNFVSGKDVSALVRGKDMAYEYWINGLLSSPTTHAVNALSNSLVVGWSVGDRVVASAIGRGVGSNSISSNEVVGQLFGIVQGGKDGFKLAWQAIKTGDPSDALTKVEQQQFKRITSENLNLTGVPGRFADFIGEVVRVPGRMLTAGDELFKGIGYRMELNAQAYRTAAGEGLKGDELAARIQNIINNPPENIQLASVDAARYQTFTKELGHTGQAAQELIRKIPGARVIVPFQRTPTNIVKWVGEHTPLAPLNGNVQAEIMAGGARRDMALAKIATGSMAMAVAADFAMSGDITGGGPKDYKSRNILLSTGWQPYSIKWGDTYYAYSRLDPIGSFIGLAADATEVIGQVGEADVMDLTMATVTSVAQNITSKTYLSGVAEFVKMMSSIQADPEAKNIPARRWVERLGGSLVPSGVAQLERTLSPELSATQGIIEKIQSRVPGWSDSLPPRRNIFGEPIVLSGGLGPDIMSPIYTSTDKQDPVADEMVRQGTLVRMPLKNIGGVELTTEQYDDYVLFYSGKDNEMMGFQSLHDALDEEMAKPRYTLSTDGPDGMKSERIRTIFAAYKQSAQAEMLRKYPEIKTQISLQQAEKAEKLRGF